jgi:uncharacterized protein (TIGR02117 family)
VKRRTFLTVCLAAGILPALAGCRVAPVPVSPEPPGRDVTVYLTASGWHTGIALPVNAIQGPLRALLRDFPGADYLLFGWGDRDYYMAKGPTGADALRALFPGPAVLLVTPLDRSPQGAPVAGQAFALGLTMAGFDRLAGYVWAAFGTSAEGTPRRIAGGPSAGSVFYAATGTYSSANTCNTWVAEGLRIGGLPVTSAGVVFAHQVVDQVQDLRGITD